MRSRRRLLFASAGVAAVAGMLVLNSAPPARTPLPATVAVDGSPDQSDQASEVTRKKTTNFKRCRDVLPLNARAQAFPTPPLPDSLALQRTGETISKEQLTQAATRCSAYLDQVNGEIKRSGWPISSVYHQIKQQMKLCNDVQIRRDRLTLESEKSDIGKRKLEYAKILESFVAKDWEKVREDLARPGAVLSLPAELGEPGKQKNVLHLAIQFDAPLDIVDLAIDRGIRPSSFLLPMALNKGREDIYLKLAPLTEGVNAMLFDGTPPWGVYVSARDRRDLLQLLAKHGADYTLAYEAYGNYGSPLDHYLISHSGERAPAADVAIVELLVSRGASVNARTLTFDLPPQVRRAVAKSCVSDRGGNRSG